MKQKLFFFFAILLIGISLKVQAYDFSAVCSTGQTLYYKIKSSTAPYTVEIENCTQSSNGSLTIPNSVTYNGKTYSVTSIDDAFSGCTSLTSVIIPSSVDSIKNNAFYMCSGLISVTIPNSVTSIGGDAFYKCNSLISVTIPNSVTSIGYFAFQGCSSLKSIIIGSSVTSIGYFAFQGCSELTSITIPNSVTSIGYGVFQDCSGLTSVTIGSSVISIGVNAFYGCSRLTSVTIPNSVTSIGLGAFCSCSGLTFVTIGSSVISIGDNAFYGCSGLTSVTIPNSVTSIGLGVFRSCTGLTSVTIPNSVTSIGDNAFYDCTGLTLITSKAINPPTIWPNTFYNVNKTIPVYVPVGSKPKYQSNQNWSYFTNFKDGSSRLNESISFNDRNIKLYPNPASTKVILEIEGINEETEIIIYDLFGRIIEKCKFASIQKQLEINVEGLDKGVYNIKIFNENHSFTKKLIIE